MRAHDTWQCALNGVDWEGELPFDRLDEPEVLDIQPSGGPLAGGTIVTIRGRGLRPVEQEDTYVSSLPPRRDHVV